MATTSSSASGETLTSLKKDFRNPHQHHAERAAIGIKIRARLKKNPKENKALLANIEDYLKLVMSTPVLTKSIIRRTLEKQKLDPYYLPNQLPSFLSEPEGGSKKTFQRRRMAEHVARRETGEALSVTKMAFQQEVKFKAAMRFHPQRRTTHTPQQQASYAKMSKQFRETKNTLTAEGTMQLQHLQYLSMPERENLRKFIAYNPTSKNYLLYEAGFTKSVSRDPLVKIKPATTRGYSSHQKQDVAAIVINNRGEIFFNTHIYGEFYHSSFMQGSDVLYAGEIAVDKHGYPRMFSDHSGHYKPSIKDMYQAYRFLKDKNLDLSKCQFRIHNQEKLTDLFEKKRNQDPALKERYAQKKLNSADYDLIRKLTQDARDSLSEADFVIRAENELEIPTEKRMPPPADHLKETRKNELEKIKAVKELLENPCWESTVTKGFFGRGGTETIIQNKSTNVPRGVAMVNTAIKGKKIDENNAGDILANIRTFLKKNTGDPAKRHPITQAFYDCITKNKPVEEIQEINARLNKAFAIKPPQERKGPGLGG